MILALEELVQVRRDVSIGTTTRYCSGADVFQDLQSIDLRAKDCFQVSSSQTAKHAILQKPSQVKDSIDGLCAMCTLQLCFQDINRFIRSQVTLDERMRLRQHVIAIALCHSSEPTKVSFIRVALPDLNFGCGPLKFQLLSATS